MIPDWIISPGRQARGDRVSAIRYDAAIGRHVVAEEGELNRAPCGCVSRVIDGKWQVLTVCDGGRRLDVETELQRQQRIGGG
jgi:hypothetical protein